LAFPTLRQHLQKGKKERVILWHSAMVYVMTQYRNRCIMEEELRGTGTGAPEGVLFEWAGWKAEVVKEVRKCLWDIYQANGHGGTGFVEAWVAGNGFVRYEQGSLQSTM
jgi:hypothetical protein